MTPLVLFVALVSLAIGSPLVARHQLRQREAQCQCRCQRIAGARVIAPGWSTSETVCLAPDDPNPSAHFRQLQQAANTARHVR